MKKVIILKGLPGSGKSTFAREYLAQNRNTTKRVSKDDLRAMLDDSFHSKDTEKFILVARDALILAALENGKHVLVDDTNLASKHIAHITQLVRGKAIVEIKDFTDVDIDTCIQRDLKRCNSVGAKVIRQMYNQFLKPNVVIEYNPELPDAIICDLDGTLALMNGRDPYDASTCNNDLLNAPVAQLLHGRTVLLVSGREAQYRPQTLEFLRKYNIAFDALHMRPTGDNRKDWIIKREIFDNKIRDKYNIQFVLDDRNRVVELWRTLGLTCLQVADGDF